MDMEREARISRRAYQFWLDEGNPDEWYNWFRACQEVEREDREGNDDLAGQISRLTSSSGEASTLFVRTKAGREVPLTLCGGQMLSVSNREIMRLLLNNQAQLSTVFNIFAKEEEEMPFSGVQEFARHFNIEPTLVNTSQLNEVFTLVNFSEAADDDRDSCDVEEFTELVVRLSVFYSPSEHPLTRAGGVVEAVRSMFEHMNSSKGGASLVPPVHFNVKKSHASSPPRK